MEEGTQLQVSIDKLPIKRLESIEENGIERFPSDVDYDEKRLSLIRRIDFAWAVEKDDEEKNKKQKKASKEASTPWQWQSMVENLQLAHQELSVIIDLINTVEANDAVTVASMTRPKLLSNEALSDLAVSAATKLQCYRHVGKYFKQSAKAFERQVAREARFYGALIRLQQNWKVKRQRQAAIAPGSEGFTFDLFDTSYDQGAIYRSSSTSTVHVNHNPAGMLAINVSPNSCHSLQFGFVGAQSEERLGKSEEHKSDFSDEHHMEETDKKPLNDEVCVKKTHSLLREVHKAIFNEQVFDLVNREAFNASTGVTVTGIRENYLQLSLGQGTSVYLSLVPSDQDRSAVESESNNDVENANLPESSDEMECDAKHNTWKKEEQFHHSTCYEIYIQQIFHDYIFGRGSEKPVSSGSRLSGAQAKDGSGLLGHFFMSLAHRIFSIKVLKELENVACKVPYLQLISNPTWNSRASSWTLNMEVPQSIIRTSDFNEKNALKRQFWTKVLVNDDCINVKAEGSPNVSGLFKGKAEETHTINRYDCNIADLAVVILQQVASQIINWLYHEAMMVGIKANRDFLSLCFELEQGETLCLIANVDPEDIEGCISWWLVMADSFAEEQKLHMNMNMNDGASEYRKFLGHLSLELLYATLMDLVGLCCGGSGGVRISLDTELSMIREDNFENNPRLRSGTNWRRMDIGIDYPFSKLPDSEIERFPYAILEVKLQTQYGQEPPEWVQELVQSHLVEAVPKFSKFIHGVATLMDSRQVPLFPFWLPQMDIDIRKPPSNFRLERPTASNPATPANERGNPFSGTEDIEVLVDNPEDDDDDDDENTPLLDRSSESASSSQNTRSTPHISSLEELEDYLATITPAGKVPKTYHGKKIAIPVRVEPKVFFANERTFLSWLNFTVTLGGIAIGLLNFGDKITVTAAALLIFVTMMIMIYSLGTYLWRARKIRKRESGPYEDRYGPTIVCGLLIISVIVNFWLRST